MTKVTGLVGAETRSPKLDSLAGHLTHCRPLGLSGQPLDSKACVLRLSGADWAGRWTAINQSPERKQ
jgi:hypothetical protein